MKKRTELGHLGWLILSLLSVVLLGGCVKAAETCSLSSPVDLSHMETYFSHINEPFQFPLTDPAIFTPGKAFLAKFAEFGRTTRGFEYHAAEDILQQAGTPVVAMADGEVSFSGPMGGYGWLVIIDHPQANIYSLYGHLSPSRWQIAKGPVQKGELIGYLGDSDENGGSEENPMRPHLHFGVRVGQRADYPSRGQWRWQAGWIKLCPQDLGWMQPSLVIASQDLQIGERNQPTAHFVAMWWGEILFSSIFVFSGVFALVFSIKQNNTIFLVVASIALMGIGWIYLTKGSITSYILFGMAALFIVIATRMLIRRSRNKRPIESY